MPKSSDRLFAVRPNEIVEHPDTLPTDINRIPEGLIVGWKCFVIGYDKKVYEFDPFVMRHEGHVFIHPGVYFDNRGFYFCKEDVAWKNQDLTLRFVKTS